MSKKITHISNGDDWEAVYIDGRKALEGHKIHLEDLIKELGHEYESKYVPAYDDNIKNYESTYFPDSL